MGDEILKGMISLLLILFPFAMTRFNVCMCGAVMCMGYDGMPGYRSMGELEGRRKVHVLIDLCTITQVKLAGVWWHGDRTYIVQKHLAI